MVFFSYDVFGKDCSARITYILENLYSPIISTSDAAFLNNSIRNQSKVDGDITKAIILNYNMEGDKIDLVDTKVIYNYAPDHFQRLGDFTVRQLSYQDKDMQSFLIKDPLLVRVSGNQSNRPGTTRVESANFPIIIPFKSVVREPRSPASIVLRILNMESASRTLIPLPIPFKREFPFW